MRAVRVATCCPIRPRLCCARGRGRPMAINTHQTKRMTVGPRQATPAVSPLPEGVTSSNLEALRLFWLLRIFRFLFPWWVLGAIGRKWVSLCKVGHGVCDEPQGPEKCMLKLGGLAGAFEPRDETPSYTVPGCASWPPTTQAKSISLRSCRKSIAIVHDAKAGFNGVAHSLPTLVTAASPALATRTLTDSWSCLASTTPMHYSFTAQVPCHHLGSAL